MSKGPRSQTFFVAQSNYHVPTVRIIDKYCKEDYSREIRKT